MYGLKIVSGGQTGADRAALDWARANNIPHGGWCPLGRRAEDGAIAACYELNETPNENYEERTHWNVRDSDGTLIISLAPKLSSGSQLTLELARKLRKPVLHLHPGNITPSAIREFVTRHGIKVLNVAGPRESIQPGISAYVKRVLQEFGEGEG